VSTNLAASVRARLSNLARANKQDIGLVFTRYGLERLLYRLSKSAYSQRFLLKGALLFNLWYDVPHRPTRDADLLGFGANDIPVRKNGLEPIPLGEMQALVSDFVALPLGLASDGTTAFQRWVPTQLRWI
jgi:hypothetical protein